MKDYPEAELELEKARKRQKLEREFNRLRPSPLANIITLTLLIAGFIFVGDYIRGKGDDPSSHYPQLTMCLFIGVYSLFFMVNRRIDILYKLLKED